MRGSFCYLCRVMEIFRQLHHIDKDITLAINGLDSQFTDPVWQLFSDKYIWAVLYLAVLVFLFRNLGWKRALVVVAGIVLTITCCDQLGNLTKAYFARLRPCWDGEMVQRGLNMLEGKGSLYGFYSAHAANAMGFAVSSWMGFRNDRSRNYNIYGVLIVLWALLVGMSRVFVGKHFFGDVCTGFAVGALVAVLISLVSSGIINFLAKRSEVSR